MIWLGMFLAGVAAAFGLPHDLTGLIVLLCEQSWGKRTGEMGSVSFLAAGGILCLPAFLLCLAVLLDNLSLLR
jgi:hypothetical protein